MAIVGTFTKDSTGYSGSIRTLALNIKAKIVPAEADGDKAPDFRVLAGSTEIGAAWKRVSRAGRDYLSVRLDDPSFAACVYASLVEASDGYALVWSR